MASAGEPPTGPRDAADQNFDYMFKLLLIGNSSVGKTSFLFRYADDSFTPAFVSTVGIDFKVKTVYRHDKRIKLQIWVGPVAVHASAVVEDLEFLQGRPWEGVGLWERVLSEREECSPESGRCEE